MISPEKAVEAILSRINTAENKILFGIETDAVEMHEDLSGSDLQPPYILVYADPDEDAKIASDGTPYQIPVSVSVTYVSSQFETSSEAFITSMRAALNIVKKVKGYYEALENINGDPEDMLLECKTKPFDILSKSKNLTSIKVNFTYKLDLIF